ncbi:hypothetical protein [Enterococcus dispar]|uniref:hypothetical protein n=1 Tax=Enterococcus dispar TaxID=44009 RepID=UPI00232D5FA9|nr:hypothetical protein [Enterococcus dispar]WCG31982.1 hypothetical protein PML78_07105 [Enterococcus dispar]
MKKFVIRWLVILAIGSSLTGVFYKNSVAPTNFVIASELKTEGTGSVTKLPAPNAVNIEPDLNQKTDNQTFNKRIRNIFAFGLGSILAFLAMWRQRKN